MDDLRQRFATLDRVPVPDVWNDVERRAEGLRTASSSRQLVRVAPPQNRGREDPTTGSHGPLGRDRTVWLLLVAALLAALAIAGAVVVGSRSVPFTTVVQTTPNPSRVVSPPPSTAVAGPAWSTTGSMTEIRFGETATLLPDGGVLIAGGRSNWGGHGASLATAEVYQPATGRWTPTGHMNQGRQNQAAILMASGKVLVLGGDASGGGSGAPRSLSTAELYDPLTGLWSNTGNLTTGRAGATATLLPDGKLLVTGGVTSRGPDRSAEIYDPSTGTWTKTGAMGVARTGQTATLLPDGRVLVVGGGCCDQPARASAELYDPASGTWTKTGSLASPRVYHSAVLLRGGSVLVYGGDNRSDHPALTTAELYSPLTGRWIATAGPHSPGNLFETLGAVVGPAVRLSNDKVLAPGYAAASELYDPVAGSWSSVGGPTGDLYNYVHTSTPLADGRVLVTYEPAAALFDPAGTP